MHQPTLLLLTGPIAVGKTSIAAGLPSVLGVAITDYVSPDLYMQRFFRCGCCQESDMYERAKQFARWKLDRLKRRRASFTWETVLGSQWKWDYIAALRTERYLVDVVIV